MKSTSAALIVLAQLLSVRAHLAPWGKGMYCLEGATGNDENNNADIVQPLYQMSKADWWFHAYNGCDRFPPDAGEFLELPAGGEFTVEIASNRGKTSLAFDGAFRTAWGDGLEHPDDYNVPTCITSPNMHTQNQSMAAGTAFAISYTSDIKAVTPENLAVFTVAYNTPWKMLTTYQVPAAMPACPPEGCICGWGWIPNGCGQPNMYHTAWRCKVTGATSTKAIGVAKPPVWCEGNDAACTKGPKQMLYWHQNEGDNIAVSGDDLSGHPKTPVYNNKCGFANGAQNDIFTGEGNSAPAPAPAPAPAADTNTESSTPAKAETAKATPTPAVAVGVGSDPAVDSGKTPLSSSVEIIGADDYSSSSSPSTSTRAADTTPATTTPSSSTATAAPALVTSSSTAPTTTPALVAAVASTTTPALVADVASSSYVYPESSSSSSSSPPTTPTTQPLEIPSTDSTTTSSTSSSIETVSQNGRKCKRTIKAKRAAKRAVNAKRAHAFGHVKRDF